VVDTWSHEPNLDFLRTVAVLCVVVRHVLTMFDVHRTWWLNLQALGIFGVLMFFVHTSLVLMISLERTARTREVSIWRLWCAFFIRRVFRIYPLSITAVAIAYFALVPFADASAVRAGISANVSLKELWANLLLVQDLAACSSILAPLWSLPAEVQMYLLLPFLFLIVKRRGARAIVWFVWPISVAVAILTWKLNLRFTVARFAPCFIAGIGCFGLLRTRRPLGFLYFPVLIGALLIAYMAAYNRFRLQAGLGIMVTVVLGATIPCFATTETTWLRRSSQLVARYSYGIYLFHVPCVWIAFGKLHSLGTLASTVCLVVLVALASVISYHLIEDPFVRIGKRVASRTVLAATREVGAGEARPAVSP
jgi:peptidoglycan/LPS O-acetylase OafA/YrhL